MANKWQICIDVDEETKDLLCAALEFAVRRPPWQERVDQLAVLKAQIKLAWIEKEVEIIPPPSKWSKHFAHAVDHSTNPL